MEIRNLAIFTPFTMNWRLAAPRDYKTLEYFLTPELSIIFRDIRQGTAPFYIGAFLTQAHDKEMLFNREILPQRSQERIREAFKTDDISAFFTVEEAKVFENAFLNQGYICRSLEVHYLGRPVDIWSLEPELFEMVTKEFARMKVIGTMDFEATGEALTNIWEEMYGKALKAAREERSKQEYAKVGVSKKSLKIRAAVASSLIAVSAVSLVVSRTLFKGPGGFWKIVAGAACVATSIITGIVGKKLGEEAFEYLRKGTVIGYA